MNKFFRLLRDWMLVVCMVAGVLSYCVLSAWDGLRPFHGWMLDVIDVVQPVLIFAMLFVSFCKVEPRSLRLVQWQAWGLALQLGVFILGGVWLANAEAGDWGVCLEALLLCFVCPTATAAVVITGKLGGDVGTQTAYTLLSSFAAAVVLPVMVPFIHPGVEMGFWVMLLAILRRVFPTLVMPPVLAFLLRWLWPRGARMIAGVRDLAFYLWAVALFLALATTTRAFVHSTFPLFFEVGIALASLVACVVQFAVGRWLGQWLGNGGGQDISAAQALGQKNTVFAIWVGQSFLTPVTCLAGGFYSIWHNLFNSYQLWKKRN